MGIEKTKYTKEKIMIWYMDGRRQRRIDFKTADEAMATQIIVKLQFLKVINIINNIYYTVEVTS